MNLFKKSKRVEFSRSFVDLVLNGEKTVDEIDDFVEAWENDINERKPLHECLGLTYEQYAMWLLVPSYIEDVIINKVREKK